MYISIQNSSHLLPHCHRPLERTANVRSSFNWSLYQRRALVNADLVDGPLLNGDPEYLTATEFRICVKIEVAVPGFFCPNEPYGFCGRKATLNHASALVTVCP